MAKGILVDYEWCSGCHSCEMACAVELSHDFPDNHAGIKVVQEGPYKIGEKKWTFINMPIITDLCDRCANRAAVNGDERPTCVKHCQARCLKYGEVEELAKELAAKPKQLLYCLEA